MDLPRALLLDLDDTILEDSGNTARCWRDACLACRSELGDRDPAELHQQIERTRAWFWADPERHRQGRLDLDAAARTVVARALAESGPANANLAATIAAMYRQRREATAQPFPHAVETLRWLREMGCRLALVTNGRGTTQRDKVTRFSLEELFDAILIEGELGFGKPDPRIYARALEGLAVAAGDAWMVGDNLECDVEQPQKMGLQGIWLDVQGAGLPPGNTVRPHRILRTLSELRLPV